MTSVKEQDVPEQVKALIESIHIKGFRGFKDILLAPLARVNLITGKNNVGKTALLEALFIQLGPNNPELLLRTNVFRGIDRFNADPEELWGSFFFERNLAQPIEIRCQCSDSTQNKLRITLVASNGSQISARGYADRTHSLSTTQTKRNELVFEYQSANKKQISRATLSVDGEINYKRASISNLNSGIFFSTGMRFLAEDAARFSRLERVGHDNEVVEIMQIVEPWLRKLSVLFTGGVPLIHADIGSTALIPIPMMGEGMARILSIILGVISSENGIVLIDEIEDGLHYSIQEMIWQAIASIAQSYQVQIFATTHSLDCIRAAHIAFFNSSEYAFALHRLDRVDDELKVFTYDQDTMETSMAMNWEIR